MLFPSEGGVLAVGIVKRFRLTGSCDDHVTSTPPGLATQRVDEALDVPVSAKEAVVIDEAEMNVLDVAVLLE